MYRVLILIIMLNLYNPVFSSIKESVISKMKLTNNLSFSFVQRIGEKKENGKCLIEYPKKIYCEYNNSNKKIVVSNGQSLVIKNRHSKNSYVYPLNKTPLALLLNKNYLISQLKILEPRIIDNTYINFTINKNDNEINIFFDKNTFDLMGWQTEDIYQNLTITFISSVKINQKIDSRIFILPEID